MLTSACHLPPGIPSLCGKGSSCLSPKAAEAASSTNFPVFVLSVDLLRAVFVVRGGGLFWFLFCFFSDFDL